MADTDQSKSVAPSSRTPTPAETSNAMTASLEDRSKFIRTMAKDMAALSGAAVAAQTHAQTAAPAPKKEETVAGVSLPVEEQPFFEKPRPANQDVPQERVDLPSMQEAGSILESKAPVPVQDPEREAVLERLRRKVGESAQMSIQQTPLASPATPETLIAPAPTEPTAPLVPEVNVLAAAPPPPVVSSGAQASEWSNIPASAPSFASFAEPSVPRIPPVRRETYREPIEPVTPPRPIAPAPTSDRLHTYTSDFADTIDTSGASAFTVLAAEQDARASAPQTLSPRRARSPKALVAVFTAVLLLALAGGGIFATYRFVMTMRDTPIASLAIPSIVFADEYRELSGTGANLLGALANAANDTLLSGNVLVTYAMAIAPGEEAGLLSSPMGGASFIRAMTIPAPDILLRNVAEESTVGVISAGGETRPFFALRVDSYERTYAGMLTWEPLMFRDLSLLYPLYAPEEAPAIPLEDSVATSTQASSTQNVRPEPVPLQPASALTRFTDTVVANHDVRILRDTNGRPLILYGYADKRTLLIARDEAAFEALLVRLKSE